MVQQDVTPIRCLVLVLGDQLSRDSHAFDGFDRAADRVLMMELAEEASFVPQHKQRLLLFFAAMRHFRDSLRADGFPVCYSELDHPDNRGSFEAELRRWIGALRPERVILAQPGDYRVANAIRSTAACCAWSMRRIAPWPSGSWANWPPRRRTDSAA